MTAGSRGEHRMRESAASGPFGAGAARAASCPVSAPAAVPARSAPSSLARSGRSVIRPSTSQPISRAMSAGWFTVQVITARPSACASAICAAVSAGCSAGSWQTTGTPSAASTTSSATSSMPSAAAAAKPSSVFSANRPRAPRWPIGTGGCACAMAARGRRGSGGGSRPDGWAAPRARVQGRPGRRETARGAVLSRLPARARAHPSRPIRPRAERFRPAAQLAARRANNHQLSVTTCVSPRVHDPHAALPVCAVPVDAARPPGLFNAMEPSCRHARFVTSRHPRERTA